jgi:hypothetical protein
MVRSRTPGWVARAESLVVLGIILRRRKQDSLISERTGKIVISCPAPCELNFPQSALKHCMNLLVATQKLAVFTSNTFDLIGHGKFHISSFEGNAESYTSIRAQFSVFLYSLIKKGGTR